MKNFKKLCIGIYLTSAALILAKKLADVTISAQIICALPLVLLCSIGLLLIFNGIGLNNEDKK